MADEPVEVAVQRYLHAVNEAGIRAARAVLFGSHARGEAGELSDIDLVVISEDFTGKDYWERIDILSNAIFAVFKPIEAIASMPECPPIQKWPIHSTTRIPTSPPTAEIQCSRSETEYASFLTITEPPP